MKVLISYPFYFVFVHVLFTVLFSSSIGSTGTHARVHSATLNSGTNGHSAPAPAPTDIQVLFDDADEHGVWQQFYAHHHLEKSDSDHEERYAASSTNSSTNSVGKPDDTNDANTGDTRTQCMDTDQNVCIVDKDNNVLQVFSPLRERSATATSSHPEPGLVGHWTFDTTPPFDVSATHQYQVTAWPLQLSGPGRQSNGFSAYSNGSNCYTFLDQHAAYRDELASPDEGRRHDGADSGQYSLLFWIFPFQSAVGDFRNIIHKV